MLLANQGVPRNVGILIAVIVTLGWLLYVVFNLRKSRAEVGSEIELAPNRKPYYSDDELETTKLNRSLLGAVALLGVVAVALPLYWLGEPARHDGRVEKYDEEFVTWGSQLFATTAEGGFNCAGCHGAAGVGGVAPYTFTDPRTGQVKAVQWKAPALNTIFYKFSEEEVRYILNYGRPFSPMSAWGVVGGGPMNEQQINNLIAYLKSIQLPVEQAREKVAEGVLDYFGVDRTAEEYQGKTPVEILDAYLAANPEARARYGEALFNNPAGSGAYGCARCHTMGWSYDEPGTSGGGAFGPNLSSGSTIRQFPDEEDMVSFITRGSEQGRRYGTQGQGAGRMPGFGVGAGPGASEQGLLTDEQIRAIVEYERGL